MLDVVEWKEQFNVKNTHTAFQDACYLLVYMFIFFRWYVWFANIVFRASESVVRLGTTG